MSPDAEPLSDNPFVAPNFFYGKLLDVADLELEQGYHRGKGRMHHAGLHGSGVVWGLRVGLGPGGGTLTVGAGLAVDRAGRVIHLDKEAVVDLRPRCDDVAHVTITHSHQFTDPVGAGDCDPQFARILEGATVGLVPGPAPGPAESYCRVRMLFGLLPATDPEVVAARDEVAALADAERPPALLRWLRALAAEDVMDLTPDTLDGSVVLAEVRGDRVENRVRTVLLPGALVQELRWNLQ